MHDLFVWLVCIVTKPDVKDEHRSLWTLHPRQDLMTLCSDFYMNIFLQSLLICRGGRSFFGRKESFPPFGTGTGSDITTGRPLKDLSKHVNSQPINPLMGEREERYTERG